MSYVSRLFGFHRFSRCSPFRFFDLLKYIPTQFSFHLLAGSACLHFSLTLLVLNSKGWFVFVFSNQLMQFVVEILSFNFVLIKSESDASLALHHSLFYTSPKMFLLFLVLSWAWFKIIFLNSYLGFFLFFTPRYS